MLVSSQKVQVGLRLQGFDLHFDLASDLACEVDDVIPAANTGKTFQQGWKVYGPKTNHMIVEVCALSKSGQQLISILLKSYKKKLFLV